MLFKWVDKIIDSRVQSASNFFRKIGRRSERVYYTAYRDWLEFMSRRSHDKAVKIAMVTVGACWLYIAVLLKNYVYMYMDDTPKHRVLIEILKDFNEQGPVRRDEEKYGVMEKPINKIPLEDLRKIDEFFELRNR